MHIVPPTASQPIINENGTMSDQFRLWALAVTRAADVITGTGSPEGVIDANQTQMYMDDAGTAGLIMYVKRDTDIAGAATKGWILG